MADVAKLLEENTRLQTEKNQWNPQWQLVSEYVGNRKASFNTFVSQGEFINSDVWSDVAAKASETAASALIGLVWPDSYSFTLDPFGDAKDDEQSREWLEFCTKELQADMDDPDAGLSLSLDEFFLDLMLYGTPAVHVEEGEKTTFKFDAWNVSQFAIDENAEGYVDTFFKQYERTVRQAVEQFGLDKVSEKNRKAFEKGNFGEKVKILHVIRPRLEGDRKGNGAQGMAFMSIYIDVDEKKVIKESGFEELPTFSTRFSKRIGEKYGRSPAMRALPTIIELNALWEIITLGMEKSYDPPLAVYDDGTFGGGTIDTSAGAINVLNVSGKLNANRAPIETIMTVGSVNEVAPLLERLENTVNDHFMIDRLLDTNNEREMTAREALIRQSLRQASLRSPLSRIISELFNRMISRCFNIKLRKGDFGYIEGSPEFNAAQAMRPNEKIKTIPQKIVDMQGKRAYRIRYSTPAAREQQAEEAQGILNWYEWIGHVGAIDQSALDIPNTERTAKKLGDIWAVPQECKNTEEEVKAIRAQKAQAMEQQAGLQQAAAVAGIAKDASAAAKV